MLVREKPTEFLSGHKRQLVIVLHVIALIIHSLLQAANVCMQTKLVEGFGDHPMWINVNIGTNKLEFSFNWHRYSNS